MKKDIHPDYTATEVSCTCGASFTTRSTLASGAMRADVCSQCHPFYTGKQKQAESGGQVDKFKQRFGVKAVEPKAAEPEAADK